MVAQGRAAINAIARNGQQVRGDLRMGKQVTQDVARGRMNTRDKLRQALSGQRKGRKRDMQHRRLRLSRSIGKMIMKIHFHYWAMLLR